MCLLKPKFIYSIYDSRWFYWNQAHLLPLGDMPLCMPKN